VIATDAMTARRHPDAFRHDMGYLLVFFAPVRSGVNGSAVCSTAGWRGWNPKNLPRESGKRLANPKWSDRPAF